MRRGLGRIADILRGGHSVSFGAPVFFGGVLPETAPGRAPFGVCVDSVFGMDECAALIERSEPNFGSLASLYPKAYRNHSAWDIKDEEAARIIFDRLKPVLPSLLHHGNVHTPTSPIPNLAVASWKPVSCNPLLRFSRYASGEGFPSHLDGHYRPSDTCESLLSVLIYLNGSCKGGETLFFDSSSPKATVLHSISPQTGRVAIFDHDVWHAGTAPSDGTKYILRSDVVFEHISSVNFDSDAVKKLEQIRDAASTLFRAPWSAERDYTRAPATPFALLHHSNYIMGAAITNDGLLTASRDRTIALWRDGRVVRSFMGHKRSVLCVSTVVPGFKFVSGSRDGSIRLWNEATGETEAVSENVHGAGANVLSLCVIGGDAKVLSSSGSDGCVTRLDSSSLKELAPRVSVSKGWCYRVVELTSGKLLTCSDDGISLWSPAFNECIASFPSVTAAYCAVQIGNSVVAGFGDGSIASLDCETLKPNWTRPEAHARAVRSLVSLDAKGSFASASEDASITIWKAEGMPSQQMSHRNFVRSLVVLQNGVLASAGYDGRVKLWDVKTKEIKNDNLV